MDPIGISVIMPAHQEHPFLDQAIWSVLKQTHQHLELIVVVNGPQQNLADRLRASFDDPRFRVLQTAMPGTSFAMNFGIANARHDFIARMDSDDISVSDRLEKQLAYLLSHPEATLVTCDFALIDEHNRITRASSRKPTTPTRTRRLLPYRCLICSASLLCRKELLIASGGYSFGNVAEDYELWLRLRRNPKNSFHALGDVLYHYRQHSAQATTASNNLTIFSIDITLKLREALITRHPEYLAGALFSLIELIYKLYASSKLRKLISKFS